MGVSLRYPQDSNNPQPGEKNGTLCNAQEWHERQAAPPAIARKKALMSGGRTVKLR
jgi:hypothetical protein